MQNHTYIIRPSHHCVVVQCHIQLRSQFSHSLYHLQLNTKHTNDLWSYWNCLFEDIIPVCWLVGLCCAPLSQLKCVSLFLRLNTAICWLQGSLTSLIESQLLVF